MTWRAAAAAVAAAVLLIPAHRAPPLAWLVLTPLVVACRRDARTLVCAGLIGACFAMLVALGLHAAWLATAAQSFFALSPFAALLAASALCVACALPAGLVLGVALGCAARLPGAWPIAGCAAVWAAWEAGTRMVLPYYPWIGLAVTQADAPTVLQSVSVAGQTGLSLLLAATGSALAVALAPSRDAHALVLLASSRDTDARRSARRTRACAVAIAALAPAATLAYGAARLATAPPPDAATRALCTLAAVDAGIEHGRVSPDGVLARYADATARAARTSPDAIVWPESALPRDPLADATLLARLRDVAGDAVLLVGGPRAAFDADWQRRTFNSVFRIARGEDVGAYDKREPVPFAERWPHGWPARPSWLPGDDLASGESASLLRAGRCAVGVLICFEAERPRLAADAARAGADVLVVASNDAQIPPRAIATEVAESKLRAVETGLPVLRAANRGASVTIDRYGRARDAHAGVTTLAVPPRAPALALSLATPLLVACGLTAATVLLLALFRRPGPTALRR